jgi:hypothetical protein
MSLETVTTRSDEAGGAGCAVLEAPVSPLPSALGLVRICQDEVCGREFSVPSHKSIAKYCPVCRPMYRPHKKTKYVLTGTVQDLMQERYDTRVRGRVAEIAAQLGWPKFAVKRLARTLGLAKHYPAGRRWTTAEIAFLTLWNGKRSPKWIAKQIGRSETSVILKFRRLGMSRAVTDGYTQRELARCFGVNDHCIARWVKFGWIRGTRDGTDRPNDVLRFCEGDVKNFVRNHPLEFRLDKVDQVWFLGLLLGTPLDDEEKN